MKNKVYSIFVSLLFFVVSFGAIIPTYFASDFFFKMLVLNIGYSVFGGSLLAVAINLIDYFSLKKKTINSFCDECFEFIKSLNNIEFTYIGNKELIIAEYLNTKNYLDMDNHNKDEFIKRAVDAFDKQGWNVGSSDIMNIIKSESKAFETNLNKSIISYVNLSSYLLNRLINISDDIYFFSLRMRRKHKENTELCKMAKDVLSFVTSTSHYFSLYLKKEFSNIFAATKFLQDLNCFIFRIDVLENGIVAWKEKMNDFNELLNKFICAINRKNTLKKNMNRFSK